LRCTNCLFWVSFSIPSFNLFKEIGLQKLTFITLKMLAKISTLVPFPRISYLAGPKRHLLQEWSSWHVEIFNGYFQNSSVIWWGLTFAKEGIKHKWTPQILRITLPTMTCILRWIPISIIYYMWNDLLVVQHWIGPIFKCLKKIFWYFMTSFF